MSASNPVQIERYFHNRKKHGGHNKTRSGQYLKKLKNRYERRIAKDIVEEIVEELPLMDREGEYVPDLELDVHPKHEPTYKKYNDWEY